MAPEDYLRRYAEPFQSLPMTGSAAPRDWQALLLEPDCYYPPDLKLGSGLDTLNRVDLLDILRQILATEYPQQGLSRDTVREFLEALQWLKDERVRRQAEIERMLADKEREQQYAEMLQRHLEDRERVIQRIYSSSSWCLTRPVRWLGRQYRRFHGL